MTRVLEPNKDYIIRADKSGIVNDVIEYKHGRWILSEDRYWKTCSECGAEVDVSIGLGIFVDNIKVNEMNYCPNCGAKMDKSEWEEPEINPCRGCDDYDGQGGCKSNGGCMPKPTATVKTANHGRWIKVEDDYNNHLYECSCCHTWTSLPTEEVNNGNIRYCWSCGAKMDGGRKC